MWKPRADSAAATIFALFVGIIAGLIYHYRPAKERPGSVRAAWWTLFLPFLPWLFVFLNLIVGLAVKQDIGSRAEVQSLVAEPSFWL